MFEILFISSFTCLFAGGVSGLLSFIAFDRLLKRKAAESETILKELGNPIGFFWTPPEIKGFKAIMAGSFVRSALYVRWPEKDQIPFFAGKEEIEALNFFKRTSNICFVIGFLQILGGIAMLLMI